MAKYGIKNPRPNWWEQPGVNIEEVKKDYVDGMTFDAMGKKHGVSKPAIDRFVDAHDLPRRPRRGGRRKGSGNIGLKDGEWVYDHKGIARWVSNSTVA